MCDSLICLLCDETMQIYGADKLYSSQLSLHPAASLCAKKFCYPFGCSEVETINRVFSLAFSPLILGGLPPNLLPFSETHFSDKLAQGIHLTYLASHVTPFNFRHLEWRQPFPPNHSQLLPKSQ